MMLGRKERADRLAIEDTRDPLLAACCLVGAVQGIAVKPPVGTRAGSSSLRAIASASRFRVRQVLLRDQWWRRDSGPLLAYLVGGDRPVALLPVSSRRYVLVDPHRQTRTPITRDVAAALHPAAYSFYRPFSERPLTPWDVVKFGFRGGGRDLSTLALVGIAGSLLGLIAPLATSTLVETILPGGDRGQLLQLAGGLMAAALVAVLFRLTQSFAMLRLEGKMDAALQAALWDRLLSLPAAFFKQFTAGDLATRALGISAIRGLLTGATIQSLFGVVFSLPSFALLFYYDVPLAFLATVLTIIILSVTMLTNYLQFRYQRLLPGAQARISGLVFQLLSGISKLRVAGAEARAFSLWAEEFIEQKQIILKAGNMANIRATFVSIAPIASLMAIVGMIVYSRQSTLSTAEFLGFNAAFAQFLAAISSMNAVFTSVLSIAPLYENLQPILDTTPEVDVTKSDPGELSGEIEISHLSFRYQPDGPLVLDDVSLRVEPGEFVAIVGPSGSGKSTLFRLLLGFEAPGAGSISYDGQDLAELNIQAVRHQIGSVLQHGKLLPADIFTNIVGASRLTMEDAWEAARLAGLDEDIRRMPMGMQTIVSEDAGTFSGGQRQRLMIARAIVSKPRILLLDEATSSLDNRTQETLSKNLERLQATRIVIAHRLSTVVNADRIYVVVAGKVVQSGTYDQLLRESEVFATLARRQLATSA